jgi:hypothetical protein
MDPTRGAAGAQQHGVTLADSRVSQAQWGLSTFGLLGGERVVLFHGYASGQLNTWGSKNVGRQKGTLVAVLAYASYDGEILLLRGTREEDYAGFWDD